MPVAVFTHIASQRGSERRLCCLEVLLAKSGITLLHHVSATQTKMDNESSRPRALRPIAILRNANAKASPKLYGHPSAAGIRVQAAEQAIVSTALTQAWTDLPAFVADLARDSLPLPEQAALCARLVALPLVLRLQAHEQN